MNQVPHAPLVRFYKTPSMPCPYLADQSEQLVFTHLKPAGTDHLHGVLAQAGFWRSHNILYRPDCPTCNACVPVRVSVAAFVPSRSQKRILAANKDLTGVALDPVATEEQFELFMRYQISRHSDGSMAKMDIDDYQSMVGDSPIKTVMFEYRSPEGALVACALSDELSDGLSMVFSFYEPDIGGLGTFMILDHIRRTGDLGLDYVYLGYWIADVPKMAYKTRFRPLETLGRSGWTTLRAEFNARNNDALTTLVREHDVKLRKMNDRILNEIGRLSGEVMAETGAEGGITKRVYDSFLNFRKGAIRWSRISDQAYWNARLLPFKYG